MNSERAGILLTLFGMVVTFTLAYLVDPGTELSFTFELSIPVMLYIVAGVAAVGLVIWAQPQLA
jgi:hypothetical protein